MVRKAWVADDIAKGVSAERKKRCQDSSQAHQHLEVRCPAADAGPAHTMCSTNYVFTL